MRNIVLMPVRKFENEAYTYFDKNIRKLPKNSNGDWAIKSKPEYFHNNDVDAFRHAYVSGRLTQKFGENIANNLGEINEWAGNNPHEERNMDNWNNSVGRKYGKKIKTKNELIKVLARALKSGELIVNPKDTRKYQEQDLSLLINLSKPVIAVQKSKTNRNEIFLDLSKKLLLTRNDFVTQIQQGLYPGYKIVNRNNLLIPMSIQDKEMGNNLG